jgi:hypothetical protein
MKPIIGAAVLSLIAGAAFAQTTTTVTKTTVTREEIPRIKEFVVKEHVRPVPPPAGFVVREGAVVPPPVELYSFPPTAPWHRYRYAVIGNETVLVDPADRHVVDVIR